jgi:hypothetical protein
MPLRRIGFVAVVLAAIGVAPTAHAQTTITTIETVREPLSLTRQQRTVIYRTVRREPQVPTAEILIRRGAVVPPTVVLSPLPESVYVVAPEVERLRYFYVNDQLVLVDPRTSQVVEIIDE